MFFAYLKRWFRRFQAPRLNWHVVLYTRQGCHLCDEAWELLELTRRRHGFPLEMRDIDTSPDLCARFGDSVPVVVINGQVRFRGSVNKVLLQRIVDGSLAEEHTSF